MKILIVNKFLYPRGGAETYVLQLGQYLKAQGHEVQYFGMYDKHNQVGNQLRLETERMDFRAKTFSRFFYPFRILYSLEARRKIKRVAACFHPDVVHLNNINFHLTPSVIDGVASLGIPMVQTVHDFQMLCPSHLMLDLKQQKICVKCVDGSKWNCARNRCIHGSLVKSVLGSVEALIYQKRPNYDKVKRYVCPSHFAEQMLWQNPRFRGKTTVLHNFVRIREETDAAEKQDYVLYFGRLSVEKGIEGLLTACRLLPHIPFVVAGSGPLEYLFQKQCPHNVRFVGFQQGKALDDLIRKARFSVYFPIWYENCPLSVLESQSLGTPVLANRMGGIPELIRDGETGVLTDVGTPEYYAQQIDILYRDRDRLAQMTENCRRRNDFMTLETYCEQILNIYETVVRKGGRE